ncbi:MAG: hypothetical protein A2Z15_05520 [Chloroflexi bacterium RBG_16_50_11]|nr:MAG: hypothetical protein A2Z15_05520 [Chloroflexi bacterium RBG_16_50_11]
MKERTGEKVKVQVQVQLKPEQCHHYWVIEVANGPASQGECKHCGLKKEFLNAFPEYNPLRKSKSPLSLPELPEVEVAEDSKTMITG